MMGKKPKGNDDYYWKQISGEDQVSAYLFLTIHERNVSSKRQTEVSFF